MARPEKKCRFDTIRIRVGLFSLALALLSSCSVQMRNLADPNAALATLHLDGPKFSFASITDSSPTNQTTFHLAYGAVNGDYAEYCILENVPNSAFCAWSPGPLPATFTVSNTENTKVLSVWVRNGDGVPSSRVATNPVKLDLTGPLAPSALSWSESSPTNSLSFTASWTRSASTDLIDQEIQFYGDAGCSTTNGAPIDLHSATLQTRSFAAGGVGSFTYRVTSTDTAGNTSLSACSSPMTIDQTPPANASALGWSESSPHGSTAITAAWTRSTESDLGNQKLQFYGDGSCTVLAGAAIDLASPTAQTYAWAAPGSGTYTYEVISVDQAGNSSTSGCSSAMDVNTTAPNNATALAWSVSSPTNSLSLAAAWTKSTSVNLANQKIQFYSDASCTTPSGAPIDLGSNSTQSRAFTAPSPGSYSYKITSVNSLSLESTSACSTSMLVDQTAPNGAQSLAFVESSPTNSLSITAAWTKSNSGDLANQTLQLYADAACASPSGTPIDLASNSTQTKALTAPGEGTYAFKLTSLDAAGNSASSACSSAITIDTTAPSAATGPSFAQGALGNTAIVTAQWTKSAAADLADQKIQFYSDSSCTTASGSMIDLNSSSAENVSFTAPSDGTYSFKVTSLDAVGNSSVSACATAIQIDATPPVITLTTLTGGQIFSGASSATQTLAWTASDSGGSGLKANSAKIEISSNGGSSWNTVATDQATAGPYTWTPGALNGTSYRIRVSVSDGAGSVASAESGANFTIDSVAPTLAAGEMTVNGAASGGTTNNNYVQVSFKASDTTTKVTHYCLKYNDTGAPLAVDSCWVSLTSIGVTPAASVTVANTSFVLGQGTNLYTVSGWVKDSAQNVSQLAAAIGTDQASITYTAPNPPSITGALATSAYSYASPLSQSDLTIAQNQDVYVQWKLTTAPNGLGGTPISLYYTTDNLTYSPVAAAAHLLDGTNGCAPDADHTGCYKWTGSAPSSGFFVIRAVVTDSKGLTAAASATPVNTWPPINYLAGSTDPGTNNSASSATFSNFAGSTGVDTQSFVVTTTGIVYFRDRARGILKVDPSTGNQTILIPKTGTAYVDGTANGTTSGATVNDPFQIALDFSNRLLIQDVSGLRRYDPADQSVTTIVGGPTATDTGNVTAPLDTKMSASGRPNSLYAAALFVTPDGKIYFESNDANVASMTSNSNRIRIYDPSSPTAVTSLLLSGNGNGSDPLADNSTFRLQYRGYGFDPVSSNLDAMFAYLVKGTTETFTHFDPATGVTLPAPYPPNGPGASAYLVTGMDGECYLLKSVQGEIVRYEKTTMTWIPIAGAGVPGYTADTNSAASSKIQPQDVFVSASGRVYFFERGVIRYIDASGKLRTLMGASRSAGDGSSALLARFGSVEDFKLWKDGSNRFFIAFTDWSEYKIRRFQIGGDIEHLAGNGSAGTPSLAQIATSQPMNLNVSGAVNAPTIQIDPATGDVFTNATYGIARLDVSTKMYTPLVGAGTGGTNDYWNADGLSGSQIRASGYLPQLFGSDGTNLLVGRSRYASGPADNWLRLYSMAAPNAQTVFAGIPGISNAVCGSPTPLTNCGFGAFLGNSGQLGSVSWDAYASRWVGMYRTTASASADQKRVFEMIQGGSLTDIATIPSGTRAFAIRHDAAHNLIYYCSPADKKLHKFDLTATPGSEDSTYAWPVPQMECDGRSLVYSGDRNSLIFAYTINGLWGIAEYLNP